MNASGSMSMGVKRDFLRKRLSANLSLSDVFNTQHFSLIFTGNNFVQDFYRKKTSRILTLNLTYLFGQGNDNNKQQRHQDLPQNPQPEDY